MSASGTVTASNVSAGPTGLVHGFNRVEANDSREMSEGLLAGSPHRMVYDWADDQFFVEHSVEDQWTRCSPEQEDDVILKLGRWLEDQPEAAEVSVHPLLAHLHVRRMALAEAQAEDFEHQVLMPVLSQAEVSDGVLVELVRQAMALDWSARQALFLRMAPILHELERRRGEPFHWNMQGPGQSVGRFFVLFQGAHQGALPFPCEEAALLVILATPLDAPASSSRP